METAKYLSVLKNKFGFNQFRDKQLDIVKNIIEKKKDICVIMFTGAGKSLCYQYPAVYANKVTLIVTPLISLANDQHMKMTSLGIPVCCLNSTVQNKLHVKDEILENKYRLVYITPEYLITQETFIGELFEKDILMLIAIDEAHVVSTWSQDFREAYKKLSCIKQWLPDIPIIALTATATKKVQSDIINILGLYNPLIIRTTFDRPNLIIKVIPKGQKAINDLLSVIKNNEPTIVYCQTRNMTDKLSSELEQNNIVSKSYHAGMDTFDRTKVHEDFSSGKINCVVATVAFGMGIDITIRKVIHYGIPKDMESYYQEIGRAGRDGKTSYCYLFYVLADMNNNNYFVNQIKNISYRNHMVQLALVMKNYIFSSDCRRKYILEYFGEAYPVNNCKSCDNCLNKKKHVAYNFAPDAKLLLDVINLTGNIYGGTMIVNVLRGSGNKKIPRAFIRSNLFGVGRHQKDVWWKILLRMLINGSYIKEKPISGGQGFSLSIADKGLKWMETYEEVIGTPLILQVPDDMIQLQPRIYVTTNLDKCDDVKDKIQIKLDINATSIDSESASIHDTNICHQHINNILDTVNNKMAIDGQTEDEINFEYGTIISSW